MSHWEAWGRWAKRADLCHTERKGGSYDMMVWEMGQASEPPTQKNPGESLRGADVQGLGQVEVPRSRPDMLSGLEPGRESGLKGKPAEAQGEIIRYEETGNWKIRFKPG